MSIKPISNSNRVIRRIWGVGQLPGKNATRQPSTKGPIRRARRCFPRAVTRDLELHTLIIPHGSRHSLPPADAIAAVSAAIDATAILAVAGTPHTQDGADK